MAVMKKDPYTLVAELERYCKAEWDEAKYQGDMRRADAIQDYFHKRKKEIEMGDYTNIVGAARNAIGSILEGTAGTTGIAQQYQNALMHQQMYGTGIMTGSIANGTAGQNAAQAAPDFKPEFGVLYINNKELPADWAGAKITEFQRQVRPKHWYVYFTSKWDKTLEIHLYLDVEEHNGKEVNEMARTYMEALNQRRVG
jgi:hypothetical protein